MEWGEDQRQGSISGSDSRASRVKKALHQNLVISVFADGSIN